MTQEGEAVLCASMSGIYLGDVPIGDQFCLKEGGLNLTVIIDHECGSVFISGMLGDSETLRVCARWVGIMRLGVDHALIKGILPNGETCVQHEYREGVYCRPEPAVLHLATG